MSRGSIHAVPNSVNRPKTRTADPTGPPLLSAAAVSALEFAAASDLQSGQPGQQ